MPSILTPKRRQLTRRAERTLYEMSLAWAAATGSTSINAAIGLGIRRGALHARLRVLAVEIDAIPTGIVKVPKCPHGTGSFTVDLNALGRTSAN